MRIRAGLVGTLALLLVIPSPGSAQSSTPPADAAVRLASKTPWVAPGSELVIRILAEAPPANDAELAVSVHARITSRSEFERTLSTAPRGTPLTVFAAPLSQLAPDPAGAVTVRLPVQDPDQPRDPSRLFLSREGVFPVRVELRERGGGGALAGFTTHLVNVGRPREVQPLGTSLVLPFHSAPTATSAGERRTPELDGLKELADGLSAHPDVAVGVQPTPETVEALADAGPEATEILFTLSEAAEGESVIGGPYVAIEPASLLESGLNEELTAQRARGARVLQQELGERPDPGLWALPGIVDSRVLAEARTAQVDRLIVREAALESTSLPLTLAQPFSLEARRGAADIPTLAADPGLAAHFEASPADPVLAAHHLLADLAVIYFDSPGAERVVVAMPELDWKPDRAFLDALLGGLAQSPLVEPLLPDQAFEVPPARGGRQGADLVRRPAEASIDSLPAGAIRNARRDIEDFAGLVDPDNPVVDTLDRTLLSSQAAGLTSAQRRDLVNSVTRIMRAQFARISLPGNSNITLTARTGEIPVTIQSELPYPVRARLRVESDKLVFPEGNARDLELTNTNTTERFAIQARASGAFPLRVVLESPEGDLVLGRSLFTVRSTAASGVGIALSGGAGGFLALWWARHLITARREKRQARAA